MYLHSNVQILTQLKLDDNLYGEVVRSVGILLKQLCSVVHYETIECEMVSLVM